VNGEPILLSEFESEVARFTAARSELGIDLASLGDYESQILQALVDRLLLAQGARSRGLTLDATAVQAAIDSAIADRGGSEAMGEWLSKNGYTLQSFRADLEKQMLADRMVQQLFSEVTRSAEQVRARHILVATMDEAQDVLAQIRNGADFAVLAQTYSRDLATRIAGGDLGWFPRGYLTVPEVEEAAFALQPGEVSDIVETNLGFHIVMTMERAERRLSPDALQRLGTSAVETWLASQRQSARIEIVIP
jgi:parvulin-like peptidyl-prolyl isomerase